MWRKYIYEQDPGKTELGGAKRSYVSVITGSKNSKNEYYGYRYWYKSCLIGILFYIYRYLDCLGFNFENSYNRKKPS